MPNDDRRDDEASDRWDGEFVEDYDPIRTPFYTEEPDIFVTPWLVYLSKMIRALTQTGTGFGTSVSDRVFGPPTPASPEHFEEDEEPVQGLPNLCDDYGLPPLQEGRPGDSS